eukprot:Gregarina_sp_Poly_1__2929@NODE_181_length_11831_cov_65_262326_g161_i0_p7_GENE_NODE_181_length_11831_cov_65_262326_g161_i0NODE_181_length_11831_cov_65_262326_g161_i0_p7_ORF_typecomplete_len303_score44_51Tape_meas_lam_C/PF09718_10/37Tape_meas_lam_C/PF09718_10/3_6Senescence/PF06911_12/0_94Senescence/PF06911_12/1_7e02Apolipoprotein/PF01442_18/3_4_NODE_181_length_11831_cov_65_262326_g161_i012722180
MSQSISLFHLIYRHFQFLFSPSLTADKKRLSGALLLMKFTTIFLLYAATASAGPAARLNNHHHHHGLGGKRTTAAKQPVPPPQVPLRRARAAGNPRKLGAVDQPAPEQPRTLFQQPLGPLGGLLGMPRELISNFVGSSPLMQLTGAAVSYNHQPAEIMQNHFGGFVDRTRNVADSSLDTVEQLAQGVAQRSRSVLDRATTRAADFVDHSVALGSNSLGAGIDAARNLQEEAKRIAAQAAGAAHGAVKAGELAFAGAFDRLATAVNHAVPTQDSLMAQEANSIQGSSLYNPLGTLMNLASAGV